MIKSRIWSRFLNEATNTFRVDFYVRQQVYFDIVKSFMQIPSRALFSIVFMVLN